ncbi:MAG: LacI family DNA-binding transcriptional regulator [Glaciecola sp.]|nr:LacI family DNA-binding transcriptional regulator [Glaciecola sp.]MDG1816803.1 LacI family DNA-binding transcriptional regulator [Glaciecola sp.]MDG2099165.1 LacI family DNA-binding transcriptional regulator [Glaciecola sp.]
MANIRKVAELAGVSVATVSRTLQKTDKVSTKTREKVMHAIRTLDYQPNLMAVKFRSGKTLTIVALVPDVANVFFARVISGMQTEAASHGYSILLVNTLGDETTEAHYAKMVQTSQADGLIQLRAYNPFVDYNGVLPMINACEVLETAPCTTVTLDNYAAAKSMTEHLISLGHTKIALIKGPQQSPLTQQRLHGYKDALHNAGLTFDSSMMFASDFSMSSGYLAGHQILQCSTRPTAVFCENDETAIGAIKAFKENNLQVPDDISVAGFDNIEFSQYCDPPLTTISQPAEEFGQTSVAMLINLLQDKTTKSAKVILPFELVMRSSTGIAPALTTN